jgi:hypothetical protein
MTAWQHSFRAITNQLPAAGLEALRGALARDDPRLIQGTTTVPPPLECMADWPMEAACGLAFACWQGGGLTTVREVECAFARVCCAADQQLGEERGVRYWLHFWDETERQELRRLVLPEVEAILAARNALATSAA